MYDNLSLSSAIWTRVAAILLNYTQLTRGNKLNAVARFDRGPFADRQGRMFRARLADGDERRCLGQSVNVRDRPAQFFFESLDCGGCGRRTSRDNANSFGREAMDIFRRVC